MSESHDLADPERFTAGAVGPPGQRVFYLQAAGDEGMVSLKCEKQQVAALAEYLAGILADLPEPGPLTTIPTPTELALPVVAEWAIGSLAVAWDEAADRVVLVAEELLEPESAEAGVEPATARFRLTRDQVVTFIATAAELMQGGRPPCPVCGGPIDPEGHVCPRSNGHRAR